jgi:hypothetical protein
MTRSLEERGYALRGLFAFPDLQSQRARYLDLGYAASSACDMNDVYYRLLPRDAVAAAERLELFDELEEWHLMSAHYSITVAVNESACAPPPAPQTGAVAATGAGAGGAAATSRKTERTSGGSSEGCDAGAEPPIAAPLGGAASAPPSADHAAMPAPAPKHPRYSGAPSHSLTGASPQAVAAAVVRAAEEEGAAGARSGSGSAAQLSLRAGGRAGGRHSSGSASPSGWGRRSVSPGFRLAGFGGSGGVHSGGVHSGGSGGISEGGGGGTPPVAAVLRAAAAPNGAVDTVVVMASTAGAGGGGGAPSFTSRASVSGGSSGRATPMMVGDGADGVPAFARGGVLVGGSLCGAPDFPAMDAAEQEIVHARAVRGAVGLDLMRDGGGGGEGGGAGPRAPTLQARGEPPATPAGRAAAVQRSPAFAAAENSRGLATLAARAHGYDAGGGGFGLYDMLLPTQWWVEPGTARR